MKPMSLKNLLLPAAMLLAALTASAQWGRRAPVSPEILPGNSVTFRLLAKEASRVALAGSWMPGWGAVEEMKSDTGLWTVTVGPLSSEMHTYAFVVDGVRMPDPGNVNMVRDGYRYESMFMVPGDKAALYSTGETPRGNLEKVWYPSPVLGMERLMYVYTPPGYKDNNGRYPVLYLLHGGGGDEDAWTTLGRAPQILDNLVAAGKAKPMIVVMTNGNPGQAAAPVVMPPAPQTGRQGPSAMGQGKFEESLVKDVIPFIDRQFRTLPGKDNRAVSGLSMGGMQTMNIAGDYPETFSYFGVMSMGLTDRSRFGNPEDPGERIRKLEKLRNSGVKLYWIACGTDDFLYNSARDLCRFLDEQQFPYRYLETGGGHTWSNWRIYLSELAPQLFR